MKISKYARILSAGLMATLVLTLAACGAVSSSVSQMAADEAAPEAPAESFARAETAAVNDGSDSASTDLAAVTVDRVIIYTGDITLRVANVATAVDEITALAARMGGYVSSSNLYESQSQLQGSVTIRVAADRYQDAMAALQTLGTALRQSTNSQDVTEEYIDLQARKTNLEITEASLQKMLDSDLTQKKLDDILQVQRELSNVRGDIESLAGRIRYLENQAALATITITLTPEESPEPEITITRWRPGRVAQEAWDTLLDILRNLGDAAIWGAICGLPLLVLGFIAWGALRWTYRRVRKPREKTAPAPAVEPEEEGE